MSPAPKPKHQKCSGNMFAELRDYLKKQNVGEVYFAPIDVLLPGRTEPAQPDVIFIAKERADIIKEERVEGVPDLVVEVLSPWNWMNDRRTKYRVYAKAGVREYWIIDPEARTIELFALRQRTYELIGKYGVGKTVQSRILPGFKVKVQEICPG